MEKLIYLLDRDTAAPTEVFRERLLEAMPALQESGARGITLNVADLDEAVRAAAPQRIAGAWAAFGAAVHFWLDNLDTRGRIEAVLARLCPGSHGYLVTESVVQPYERSWQGRERRPGVTQFTAHAKPAEVSEEQFYYNWQVEHSAMSFDLHPLRWSYVRNAVARALTPGAPPHRVIVLEHFRALEDFTDERRYFGNLAVVQRMYADLPGFCDVNRMITSATSEYFFD